MINLLPEDTKQHYIYARRNTRLRHWLVALGAGITGVIIIIGAGYIYINKSIASYQKQVALSQQELKIQKLDDTQKQVEDITSSLKLVVQVLSREVLFSKLIQQIGSVIPPGSVLTGLSINKIQGGIDLTAQATTYQTATQVQINLQDPKNKIFDKADINQVQCNSPGPPGVGANVGTSTIDSQYPCKIVIRAQFAKENPFLFINNKPAATP